MTSPHSEAPLGAALSTDDSGRRIEEICALEEKLLGLKKDLLFKAAVVVRKEGEETLHFLVVRAGESLFAAPITNVNEVVELPALLPLNNAVKSVAGLCNYHGRMLAVVDVGELTGGACTPVTPRHVLVVCEVGHRAFALLVDEAIEVVAAAPSAVTLADEVMNGVLRTAGVLKLEKNATAQIIDLGWLAVGAQLAAFLKDDAAKPVERGKP